MALQVQDVINNTLIHVRAVAVGATPAAEDQALALMFLNLHIDSLNAAVKKALYAQFDPVLFTFNAVSEFVNPTDVASLPNGWIRALQFLTAVDISFAWGKPLGDLPKLAAEAKAAILTPAGSPPSTQT